MPLKRRHYLKLAGVDDQLFKTLQRREQVPGFARRISEDKKSSDELYSVTSAFQLALADNLASQASVDRTEAAAISTAYALYFSDLWSIFKDTGDVWICNYKECTIQNSDGTEVIKRAPTAFGGTIDQILVQIAQRNADTDKEVRSLSFVNAGAIFRRMQRVAKDDGLDIGLE
ncbi:hypothetical protein ACMG4P_22035 [Pseudovibrio denitrificans]|uniref:hypothetical protein n=1 Tax=Pseudovibrio denitrificans TaxID=258256 RepID=UPI0039BF6A8F